MLRKMLVVGVGGSGGKTVRILRNELRHRLNVLGWTKDLPAGWQFLHIDVPDSPDGNDPELPGQLPAHLYVGLSQRGLDYAEIDDIVSADPDLLKSIAGWRPEPSHVDVPVQTGAGQYRAVGRMLVHQSIEKIKDALEHRKNEMTSTEADSHMDDVSRLFNSNDAKKSGRPMVILVSSLAGGSGAGAFLDVLDAMRHILPEEWGEDILAVLYAPDIFRMLQKEGSAGVQGNVLAAVSEFTAATLNKRSGGGTHEFTLLNRAGLTRKISQRGARAFLIGRGNGIINFGDQNQVFQSVGNALASWVTSEKVQGQLEASVISNWAQSTKSQGDQTRLGDQTASVLRSFGSATVGLARDRFARYAADRLAWRAVYTLLDGHRDRATDGESPVPDEVLVRAKADAETLRFKLETGLMELGQEHNQIMEALVGKGTIKKLIDSMAKAVAAEFRENRTLLSPQTAVSDLGHRLDQRRAALRGERQKILVARAEKWVNEIQKRVLAATADLVSTSGIRVARDVIEQVADELENEIVPEFRQLEDKFRQGRKATATDILKARFAGMQQDFDVSTSKVDEWLGEALEGDTAESWEVGAARAQSVVSDFCVNFLRPLRGVLQRGYEDLLTSRKGTSERPSPVDRWRDAERYGAKDFLPPDNVLLLEFEDPKEYEDVYRRLLTATTGDEDWLGAERKAVREILTASVESEDQKLLLAYQRWSPSGELAFSSGSGQVAQFRLAAGLDDTHRRATEWVRSPKTEIGKFVGESLKSYLQDAGASATRDARLGRFRDRFRRALEVSLPLVDLDEAMLQKVHNVKDPVSGLRPILSSLPFPQGHPARDVAESVLSERPSLDKAEIATFFQDSEAQHIEITTFLGSAYNPFVYASLISPIAGEVASFGSDGASPSFWDKRRTRQLPYAIPLSPEHREAMVRGWWLARVMGDIAGLDDVVFGAGPVTLRVGEEWVKFPYPGLGSGPWAREEVLPAILESLPLALVESWRIKDLSPLKPYWRLLDLGSERAGGLAPQSLHPDVERWLDTGLGGGVDVPEELEAAGSSSDRRRLVADYYTDTIDHFRGFFEEYPPRRETASTSRAWEMQEDIRKALSDLATAFRREPRRTGRRV